MRLGICLAKIKRTAFGVDAPVDALSRDEARRILGLSNTDTVVGFVGRLAHQKAPERLVNAIAECPRQDVKLVLIGGGALEVRLREDIGRLRLGDRVVFAGVRDGRAMMPAFDLLCVPSRYESLGYVLLEAALAGLPIISSPVGVAEEVIQNGRNGLIVPNVDDPKPWADALERMLAPEELLAATSYAQSLRRTASVGRMVDETIDVYHGALRSQSLGAR